jgi:branched-chain amino acid transport system ATP-binding protein
VVFGIDLDVEEGEVVTLLGANGAGKTTTLRAISGMVPVMSGTITFDGTPISHHTPERIARAGLLQVPAGRGVFPTLSVGDTLRLAASLARLPRGQVQQRLDEVYETFPRLAERVGQAAGTLSGGEQQMLALARGLISRPRLLMVDEMSQGLAPTIVADLFAVLERFTEQGVAVLLVEQFVGQALAIAQRAYVLEKGEVSFAGSAAALAADEDFVKGSYLGDVEETPVETALASDGSGGSFAARVPLAERLTVSLPPVLVRSLEERAAREGVALADLVRQAVEGTMTSGAQADAVNGAAKRGRSPRKAPARRAARSPKAASDGDRRPRRRGDVR